MTLAEETGIPAECKRVFRYVVTNSGVSPVLDGAYALCPLPFFLPTTSADTNNADWFADKAEPKGVRRVRATGRQVVANRHVPSALGVGGRRQTVRLHCRLGLVSVRLVTANTEIPRSQVPRETGSVEGRSPALVRR